MESIKEIYRIGYGPSSSHTMGPKTAAEAFKKIYPLATSFKAVLYGSLAATGKGHLTDIAVKESFSPYKVEIFWKPDEFLPKHPNALKFESYDESNNLMGSQIYYSIGGGKIIEEGNTSDYVSLYKLTTMKEILDWTKKAGSSFWEYVEKVEGKEIYFYLSTVWEVMKKSIKNGIDKEGVLPGKLNLSRKAASYYIKARNYSGSLKDLTLIYAYALAVAEENAAGGKIVTAPTCGSCGVVPAVLYKMQESYDFADEKIYRALATAGLIGNIVKTNSSISGAQVGCQGEIGTACAMAAAATTQLLGGTPHQIEYAAEMGIEHHLGLTCDPIFGLVQVPCIERNVFAAERAYNTAAYSILSDGRHIVSFDRIVETMKQTGHDLPNIYKETSEGGLAALWE